MACRNYAEKEGVSCLYRKSNHYSSLCSRQLSHYTDYTVMAAPGFISYDRTIRHYYKISDLLMGWTVRGSNARGGDIFYTRPDRRWGPPSLLDMCRAPFPVQSGLIWCRGYRKSRAMTVLTLWAFMACSRANFTFFFNTSSVEFKLQ